MSEPDFKTLDLGEVGTRLDHYNELREIFMVGVEVINSMNPTYLTDIDRATRVRLQNASDSIQRRIDLFAKFPSGSGYGSWLQMTIDQIGHRMRLTEGTNGKQADSSDAKGQST
jgi:hypothetical protein